MRAPTAIWLALGIAASGCAPSQPDAEVSPKGGDPERGRAALAALECGACHDIPGVPGPRGQVGPPLAGFANSVYIAGRFPNQPEMLARWVREAPTMANETAMPAIAMSEAQARDIAAYLLTLD
jgi:mono/diheme cytochrome c family protein